MKQNEINVMIATPALGGQVNIQYCLSLTHTISFLQSYNIKVTPLVVESSSLLVSERNRLLEAFWNSDCTHILCIDADLGWPPQAILAMLEQEKDFIGGVYPARSKKNIFNFRPILNDDNSLVQEKHLIKMSYIPAGFLLLSRECIRKMRDFYPNLYYNPKGEEIADSGGPAFCLFNTEVWEGEFWGEDYVFCRRAREAGIDIWADPLIQFDHAGKIGMLLECLTQQSQQEQQTVYIGKDK